MGKNKASRFFAFALLSMVIVGLIGFGSVNLSGTLRTIGSVGGKDLNINTYARALQSEINAIEAQTGQPFSFAQAQLFGVDQQVLGRLVNTRMMDAEAARLGISVGDENLAKEIRAIQAFQGINGQFDRETYRFTLEQSGLNEAEFEEQIRDDSARTILLAAILGGTKTNPAYGEAFAAYYSETRDVTWAELTVADLSDEVPAPSDSDLRTYYTDNIDLYTVPESRRITYAWLTPDMLLDTVEIDEDLLKTAYERRIDEFVQPERRIVERLVFPDQAAAEAGLARINASEVSFEDLVAERGLRLSDVDMGDVAKSDLGTAGEAVFALDQAGIVGPVKTGLGPALFRVNVILPGSEISFDEALDSLREEVAYDRAARVIADQATELDDMLAAGATLEDLARDSDMKLGQISWYDSVDADIAAYAAFREEAAVISTEDFPAIGYLEDGGVFALRLDAIDPAHPEEFETVRDAVLAAWTQDQHLSALRDSAEALRVQIEAGATFEETGLNAIEEQGLTRRALVEGAPRALTAEVFALNPSEATVFIGDTSVYLVRLDGIQAGDLQAMDNQSIVSAILEQTNAEIEQDMYQAFANMLRLRTEIELDQPAINAVHANFQ